MNMIALLRRGTVYFVFALLTTCGFLIIPAKAASAANTNLYISPATTTVGNGSSFSVSINLNTTTAFLGWQTDIQYDATKIQCIGVTMGTWLSNYVTAKGGIIWSPGNPTIDNVGGSITNLAQGGLDISTGLTGSGVLVPCLLPLILMLIRSLLSLPLMSMSQMPRARTSRMCSFPGGRFLWGRIPAPSVGSFFPTAQSSGGTVIINGSNFTGATAVSFGATAAQSFIVNSATQISAVVGTGSSGAISVTAPGGTGSLAGFVYLTTPVISSFSPVSAAGSQAVTIDGSGFTGSSAVSFGGVPAASFTVNSPDQITAVIASGGTSGVVSVTNSYGTGTLPGFTFIPLPVINNFTPLSGGSGTIVTINGSGLTGTSAISFGGIPAQSFAVNSNTVITATVGSGSTGERGVDRPRGFDHFCQQF